MLRVRKIISEMSYEELVKSEIIPSMNIETKTKRYPTFVYQTGNDFSFFGMFMDYVVRAGLRIYLTKNNKNFNIYCGDEPAPASADIINKYTTSNNMNDIARTSNLLASSLLGISSPYDQQTVDKYVPTIV